MGWAGIPIPALFSGSGMGSPVVDVPTTRSAPSLCSCGLTQALPEGAPGSLGGGPFSPVQTCLQLAPHQPVSART